MQPADKVSPGRFSTQSQYVENSNRTLHQKKSSCTKSSGIPFSVLFALSGVTENKGDARAYLTLILKIRKGNIFSMLSCLKYVFGFQFGRERNVFSRYFAGFGVWTAFEIREVVT